MRFGLTARMAAAVAIVAVAFVAAVVALTVAISQLRSAADDASNAEQILAATSRVSALVVDTETGQRGFALTRKESFLDPLEQATRGLPGATVELTSRPFETAEERELAQRVARGALSYLRDYALPLVDQVRADLPAARAVIAAGAGRRRVEAIRADIDQLSALMQRQADLSTAASDRTADRALALAIGSGVLGAALLAILVAYLARFVAAPVRDAAMAASQVGGGDLSVRLDDRRPDEIGELGRSFNTMAVALQRNAAELDAQQTELESQNAELERQAVELEGQTVELEAQATELELGQRELAESNEALVARTGDLERTSSELRVQRDRTELLARVADTLGRRDGIGERAHVLLDSAADLTDASVGTVYARTDADDASYRLVAARGAIAEQLPAEAIPGQGLVGRALHECRTVTSEHGPGALRLEAFGAEVELRHEVHIPLLYGDRVVGVLSLARSTEEPFAASTIATIEQLAEQAAVSFDNAVESERRRWLANVNRAVLDSTSDAIRLIGVDRMPILTNPAMARFEREVFQFTPGPSLPNFAEFIAERTADPAAYMARVEAILADPEGEYEDEYELVDTHRWVYRFTAPVRTAGGDLIGRIFVLRETTERREAERAKDELMATVSHELRTPLAAILGFAELLMAREYDAEERHEHLQTIYQQASRLSDLVSDFLDLQRLEHADVSIETRPVDLGETLRQQVGLFSAQSTRHELSLHTADEPLTVNGDADRLRRALANLLSNAIKYSPAGGIVAVDARRHDGAVVVSITDSGLGIPEDAQPHVFDRFYRVNDDATRHIRGTGLGLALVREIMLAHGGDVGFESTVGKGSRFWFRVPASD